MDLATIQSLVVHGESETLEFKKSTGQRSRIAEAACAMANSRGGRIFVGVLDDGLVMGQHVAATTMEALHAELAEIEPPLFPEVIVTPVDASRSVIALDVQTSSMAPHACRGRAYKRSGPRTIVMPQAEYERLLFERSHASSRWENQTGPLLMADVDVGELVRTVDAGVARGRLSDPGTREPEELLRRFGLIGDDGRLLNAAAVLFGSRTALAAPYLQCVLRMARFRGVEKRQASDDRQVVANAFELLRLGEQFLLDNVPIASRFSRGQFARIDEPLYPPEALREALANALCHRDYRAGAGSVDIAVYDDRLEIVSAGGLHFGLRPHDLYARHPSRPWNPIIASMFHRRGIIEQWGMGTMKIVRLAESAGLARPGFEEQAGSLIVRFVPAPHAPQSGLDHDLSGLQRDLLVALGQMGEASLSQVLAAMPASVAARTAQENLSTLRGLDLVDSSGRGRGARWRLRRS